MGSRLRCEGQSRSTTRTSIMAVVPRSKRPRMARSPRSAGWLMGMESAGVVRISSADGAVDRREPVVD